MLCQWSDTSHSTAAGAVNQLRAHASSILCRKPQCRRQATAGAAAACSARARRAHLSASGVVSSGPARAQCRRSLRASAAPASSPAIHKVSLLNPDPSRSCSPPVLMWEPGVLLELELVLTELLGSSSSSSNFPVLGHTSLLALLRCQLCSSTCTVPAGLMTCLQSFHPACIGLCADSPALQQRNISTMLLERHLRHLLSQSRADLCLTAVQGWCPARGPACRASTPPAWASVQTALRCSSPGCARPAPRAPWCALSAAWSAAISQRAPWALVGASRISGKPAAILLPAQLPVRAAGHSALRSAALHSAAKLHPRTACTCSRALVCSVTLVSVCACGSAEHCAPLTPALGLQLRRGPPQGAHDQDWDTLHLPPSVRPACHQSLFFGSNTCCTWCSALKNHCAEHLSAAPHTLPPVAHR